MIKPRIAILLAAFNGMNWLGEQLQSIMSQRDVEVSVYISVDQSTDNTLQWCQDFATNAERVTVLKPSGHFGGAAQNFYHLIREVDFSHFDYIAFADQDDVWNINKLSRAVCRLSATNSDAYSSNVTAFWPNGKTLLIEKEQPQVQWDYLFESAAPGCTYVISKTLAVALQAFVCANRHEMQFVWMHDWFIYAFARGHCFQWTIDAESTMHYRQHTSNQVGVNSGLMAFKHRAAFVLSGKPVEQAGLIAQLVGVASSDFVKSWFPFSRLGFVKLALQASSCRRKRSERVLFFFACLLLAVVGVNGEVSINRSKQISP